MSQEKELPQDKTQSIRWPQRFDPGRAPIFVSNDLVAAAPAETVWAWLVSAPLWHTFYSNASNVMLEGGGRQLSSAVKFRWKSFGVNLDTVVEEFEPCQRIAWHATGIGVDAYHAWLLTPSSGGGCHILTQETQYGWLARLGKMAMPNRMHRYHQLWLEGLAKQAKAGPPLPR